MNSVDYRTVWLRTRSCSDNGYILADTARIVVHTKRRPSKQLNLSKGWEKQIPTIPGALLTIERAYMEIDGTSAGNLGSLLICVRTSLRKDYSHGEPTTHASF